MISGEELKLRGMKRFKNDLSLARELPIHHALHNNLWYKAETPRYKKVLSAQKSVALSIVTPLYPYGIAHRRAMDCSCDG